MLTKLRAMFGRKEHDEPMEEDDPPMTFAERYYWAHKFNWVNQQLDELLERGARLAARDQNKTNTNEGSNT